MKMKTQLTLAAVVAAGLLASGCSQQMVGQQVAQAAPEVMTPETKTIVKYDCSSCKKPAAPAKPRPSGHYHPAIPGCTKSVRHNHKTARGGAHSHKYSCRKAAPKRVAPKPAPKPAPRKVMSGHVHPAIPGCTDSIRHNHRSALGGAHKHRYACKKAMAQAPRKAAAPARRVLPGHFHPAIPGCTNSVRHNHPNRGAHSHKYSCRRPAARPAARPVVRQAQPNYQQMATPKMIKPKGTYKGSIKIDGVMKSYQQ